MSRLAVSPERVTGAIARVLMVMIGIAACWAGPALAAEQVNPFSTLAEPDHLHSRAKAGPKVQRFTASPDDRVFQLQVRGNRALVRFFCANADPRLVCGLSNSEALEEIVALKSDRSVRGDTVFRDAVGRLVIRMTPYGNATVYWPGERIGRAATKISEDRGQLAPQPVSLEAFRRHADQANAMLSGHVGKTIGLILPTAVSVLVEPPATDGLPEGRPIQPATADAVIRAAGGFYSAAGLAPEQAKIYSTLRISAGPSPAIKRNGTELVITFDPDRPITGRPSEAEIVRFIGASAP
ncbi:MAG: DUF4908 domain-containing protein [Pseudomonadota bacterium]